MKKCVNVIYKGNVQGVGFRFTAVDLAKKFRVNGFVRNTHDGDVEIFAEGEEDEVNKYLNALGKTMSNYIHQSIINPLPYTGQYSDFRIKY